MPNSHSVTTTSSSPDFQPIFNNALKAYEKGTKKDLLAHPLAAELQLEDCNSPSKILTVLYQQVQGLDQLPRAMMMDSCNWLDPIGNVLYMLSQTLQGSYQADTLSDLGRVSA
jgi:hypothetical protein